MYTLDMLGVLLMLKKGALFCWRLRLETLCFSNDTPSLLTVREQDALSIGQIRQHYGKNSWTSKQ